MANTYLHTGQPGRTSVVIADPQSPRSASAFTGLPFSVVVIPLEQSIPHNMPIEFKSAVFTRRGGGDSEHFDRVPLPGLFFSNPEVFPTFLRLWVVPGAESLQRYRSRKKAGSIPGGGMVTGGTVTGDFTVTLRFGGSGPSVVEDECKLQGTLYEE